MLELPSPQLRCWPGGRLRPWAVDDADALVAAWCDAEISRWNLVPSDPSLDRARAWIETTPDRLADSRSLDLCIVEEADVVLGEIGLSGFDEARRAALVGYWLLPAGRGRGLAAGALDALTGWALGDLGLQLLVARCATANEASQAVARRAGYVHARREGAHELFVRRAPALGTA